MYKKRFFRKKYKEYFLDTYNKSKDVFIKPRFHFYIGPWKKEGNLPVWRRGPQIHWGKYSEITEKWNYAKLESSEWNTLGKKNHPILSRIIKHPTWQLPIWLAFHWYNNDIMYKTKWEDDDFRYEFPAHITIVFFGFCISWTAYIGKLSDNDTWSIDDDYWETMLTYQFYNGDIEKTNEVMGQWRTIKFKDSKDTEEYTFRFRPEFLKKEEDKKRLLLAQKTLVD